MWAGHRIETHRHRQRWYQITIEPDLWGQWVVWTTWGRIGQGIQHHRARWVVSHYEKACRLAQQWRQHKQHRGYRTVEDTAAF